MIGAQIYAKVGEKTLYQQVLANNGAVQSERTVHFGLGKRDKVDKVTVKWPSGVTETYRDLSSGSYMIKDRKIKTLAEMK